jgi:hypothetical protein
MKFTDMLKWNATTKGIIFGLFFVFILEFGTLAVIAGFETERQWWILYLEDYEYLVIGFNFVIAGLLGIGIAKKLRSRTRLAFILNLVMLILILAGYSYFLWIRLSHHL